VKVIICEGKNPVTRTRKALEALAPRLPSKDSRILIKPNLVEPMAPESGAVTRPEIVGGIIQFLDDKKYEIIIGESSAIDTTRALELGGYFKLAQKYNVQVVNFDDHKFVKVKLDGEDWKEAEVTSFAIDVDYLISVAVLKEHAYVVTLCMKNMMGILAPYGIPSKRYMHKEENPKLWAIRLCDLLTRFKPDLSIVDGTTAMYGSHLYGKLSRLNLTICGKDVVAVDEICAKLLGHDRVFYIEMAKKRGIGKSAKIVERTSI
jgi:uncharacterized protein (DUF362 family)